MLTRIIYRVYVTDKAGIYVHTVCVTLAEAADHFNMYVHKYPWKHVYMISEALEDGA